MNNNKVQKSNTITDYKKLTELASLRDLAHKKHLAHKSIDALIHNPALIDEWLGMKDGLRAEITNHVMKGDNEKFKELIKNRGESSTSHLRFMARCAGITNYSRLKRHELLKVVGQIKGVK